MGWRKRNQLLERVRKLGSAGDSPAPVGDPPTGSAEGRLSERPSLLTPSIAVVPSGESPDGTGGSPVLPWIEFSDRLLDIEKLLWLVRAASWDEFQKNFNVAVEEAIIVTISHVYFCSQSKRKGPKSRAVGFYYRKSVNFGPFRISVSKSGVGYSVGGRAFRVGKTSRGQTYTSASIPGTGIGYRRYGGRGCLLIILVPIAFGAGTLCLMAIW